MSLGRFDAVAAAAALEELRAVADGGDHRAMLVLGRLYARGLGASRDFVPAHIRGLGAPQDFVEAHMWFNLAAGRGEAAAAKECDALAAEMTPAERAEARKRARDWQPRYGAVFRDCPECPEMVVVPAGSFTMGSPASEEGRSNDENFMHPVTIPEPFVVGKYAVMFSEWDACVSAGGCQGYRPDGAGWDCGARPAINVSWNDAKAYVGWLSGKTDKEYRLLSESEWEYAARAGTRTRYSWGNGIGRNQANCDGCGSRWDNEKTAPVGRFAANGFGLHDMHGNVWEWVEDCWNRRYAGAPSDGSAWESGDCSQRVLRGGAWNNSPWNLRAASRTRCDTGNRSSVIGFRVARMLTPWILAFLTSGG